MKRIRTGDMRHLMALQQESVTTSAYGEAVRTWSQIDELYCKLEPMSAFERSVAAQNSQRVTHRVTTRFNDHVGLSDTEPGPKMRLSYDGRTFEIRGIIDPDERRRFLELTCEETRN